MFQQLDGGDHPLLHCWGIGLGQFFVGRRPYVDPMVGTWALCSILTNRNVPLSPPKPVNYPGA